MTSSRRLSGIQARLDRLADRQPVEDLDAMDPELEAMVNEMKRLRDAVPDGEPDPFIVGVMDEMNEGYRLGAEADRLDIARCTLGRDDPHPGLMTLTPWCDAHRGDAYELLAAAGVPLPEGS